MARFELWTPAGILVQKAVDCLKPAEQEEKRVRKKVCSVSHRKSFGKISLHSKIPVNKPTNSIVILITKLHSEMSRCDLKHISVNLKYIL